jgi:hypothetical protein
MAGITYDASFAEWRRILKPFANKNGETPHLEGHVAKLMNVLTQVEEIEGRQMSLAAAKQEMSQQLKTLVVEGRKIATFLKAGLREHHGRGGEKLTEYGLQPFRGNNKTAKPEEPAELEPPAPASQTPTI